MRRSSRTCAAALAAIVLVVSLAGCASFSIAPPPGAIHVSASAEGEGDGSEARPFARIDEALAVARPGDTISVGPGTYPGPLQTVRAGEPDRPIRLIGSSARIVGEGSGRLFQILHSHITMTGFDLSGGDILFWVQGATGVRLVDNRLHDALGECVRIKYQATGNEVARNRIGPCGLEGFDLDADSKNGEGVYIGTAPEQVERNPSDEPDRSDRNWVHDNVIAVPAECVDVKEAATANVVERNQCTGGQDPEGAGFSSRGQQTVFRHNVSTGHVGAGIRLGGDEEADGIGNRVVENRLADNQGYGLKVMREPQGTICGNQLQGNGRGPVNADGDPTRPC